MIGIILLLVSWILLRLERKSLAVLGFDCPKRRLREFALGFLVTGLVVTVQQMGYAIQTADAWQLNPALTWELVFRQVRWTVNSVLHEDLLFRGYLLYQAIRFLGPIRGVILSASAFGIYHWFSFGVLGNPVAMAYVFLMTGAFGAMSAFAFVKTRSIFAPIGLHLGWNAVSYIVFSAGPAGAAVLVPASGVLRMKLGGLGGLLFGPGLQLIMIVSVIAVLAKSRWVEPPLKADEPRRV